MAIGIIYFLQMYTPLHAAASSGQVSVVKLLLEMGAEVDAVNCFGNTALHVSCHNGQDVVVTELLGYGAAINAVNNMGLVSFIFIYIGVALIKLITHVMHMCKKNYIICNKET